jgi:hypothetical protein
MQERRLQRWMKELLAARGLNVDNWRYIRYTPEELIIIHKYSLKPKVINLEGREDE